MQAIQDDESAIRQFADTWISASKAADTKKVLSLMQKTLSFCRRRCLSDSGATAVRNKIKFTFDITGHRI